MKTSEDMISLNKKQAKFYDDIHITEAEKPQHGYAENPSANVITRAWASVRNRHWAALKDSGLEEKLNETHHRWCAQKAGGDFLEVGCFAGSRFTFELVEKSGSYLGVELSPKAVATLNAKFAAGGLQGKAKAVVADFLEFKSEKKFDVIYAHGVLHHFENPVPLFEKLAELSKPDGYLIFSEPSMMNPVYSILRRAYRPFQADAGWEWPFTRNTVKTLETYFELKDGFGWGSRSLPLSVLSSFPLIGNVTRPLYFSSVKKEIGKGWHGGVWLNSYVTALCQPRKASRKN